MNFATMIVLIVAISFVGVIMIMQQVRKMRQQSQPSDEELKLKAQVDELTERVQTLERIATDKKHSLKEEIETL